MTNYKDTDLREALRRRYSDTPQLSADFADRLIQRIESPKNKAKSSRFSSLSLWRGRRVRLVGIAAAAASALLLLTLHYYNNRGGELKEMPLAETQTVAADSSSNIRNEPIPTKAIEVPLVAQAKPVKRVRRTKKKEKVEVPDLKKDMPELLETEEAVIENQAQEIRPDVPDPYVLAAIQTQNIRSRGERLHNEVALIVSNQ
ncbi:MAG: hypothetical protein IKI18_01795 [Prevotella sp.]|nr:hypothetical protein [Prevotella sp.]